MVAAALKIATTLAKLVWKIKAALAPPPPSITLPSTRAPEMAIFAMVIMLPVPPPAQKMSNVLPDTCVKKSRENACQNKTGLC